MIFYHILHIALGKLSQDCPMFIKPFISYQLLQLALNKRFFIHKMSFESGNSLPHTLFKLAEFALGYSL